MLKRIAIATIFVVSAAFAGVSVAKAQSGAKAKTMEVAPKAEVTLAIRQLSRVLTGRTLQGAPAKNMVSILSFLKGKKRA